ncbi:recombinase family protein [Coprococcus comes]|uniref:recombinase family protein n=1 Tax=Coprococcus comes TaxID=410072 RepID=UPI00356690E1
MARKSRKVDYVNVGNKENLVTEAENQCEKVSHAALYARLSYESEKNRERNTIETQMVLLHNFVKEQKDIVVAKEYYDISKTGTNFERDGFNEMMQDIKEGNIDCVIVKDLSRLGRNYVEAGSYIERVFPFFNVRFISVNDHYDSFRDDISLLISMSNVYNEFYSRDLAKKIRSSYRTSWANGEFPSGQMAYGYEKDKDNPHQLIPDPVAAPVVKKIFQYFIDGMTYAEIILTKAELLALTAADFDFEKETVRINKSYQRLHGEDVITTPKTKKSNRIIKMPKFLCEEMQDYLQMLYGLKKKDRIFTVTKSYLHHEMDRGAKAAGVKRIRIHDLRHSHISLLIDMGFSAVAIADRVGHESIDITYQYAHLFPSKQTEMADRLDDLGKGEIENVS